MGASADGAIRSVTTTGMDARAGGATRGPTTLRTPFGCPHCGFQVTRVPSWPVRGDYVAFHAQTDLDRSGAYHVEFVCPACNRTGYVVLGHLPGVIQRRGRSPPSAGKPTHRHLKRANVAALHSRSAPLAFFARQRNCAASASWRPEPRVPNRGPMVGVAQAVRAPGCGPGGRRFESGRSPWSGRQKKCAGEVLTPLKG